MNEFDFWGLKYTQAEMDIETAECSMFSAMGGTVLRDGNMYGAVIGDLPTGCAGLEKTRLAAVLECMRNFRFEEARVPSKGLLK